VYDNHGKLHSKDAFESVTHLTVDLGKIQTIRGVQLQGGVADVMFYGPACFTEATYYSVGFLAVGIALWHSAKKSPLNGVNIAFFRGIFFCQLIYLARITTVFALDTSVPSPFSTNTICPAQDETMATYAYRTFDRINFENILAASLISFMFLLQLLRPKMLFTYSVSGFFVMLALRELIPPVRAVTSVSWAIFAIGLPLVLRFLQSRSRLAARQSTTQDDQKYEDAWEQAGGRSFLDSLSAISVQCQTKSNSIKELRQRVSNSKQFAWWQKLLFVIQANGLGPYSRTRKRRQRTANINHIFEQVPISIIYIRVAFIIMGFQFGVSS